MRIFLIIIILIINNIVVAQNDCFKTLQEVRKLYNEGLLENIEAKIKPCLNNLTGEDKIEAFRLLMRVYLYQDEQDKANEMMLDFLRREPEYKLRPDDPAEFIYLYESFRSEPVYSFGFGIGGNLSYVNAYDLFGIYNTDSSEPEYAPEGLGLQLRSSFSANIIRFLDFHADVQYRQNRYNSKQTVPDYLGTAMSLVDFTERRQNIDVPLSVTLSIGKYRIKPYIRGGFTPTFLLSSSSTVVRSYLDASNKDVSGPDLSTTSNRKRFNISGLTGLGVTAKVPRGYVWLDFRYNWGLINETVPLNRYSDPTLTFAYWYVDSNFLINSLDFTLGYSYAIYIPKLRKQIK